MTRGVILIVLSLLAVKQANSSLCEKTEERHVKLTTKGKELLGGGSFGKVFGDEKHAVKVVELDEKSKDFATYKDIIKNEIATMATIQDLSFVRMLPDGCYI